MNSFYINNRRPLPESELNFLPLGSIKPTGWLKKQLRIQADGQTGHLPELWPSLGPESGWLGGSGESWERGPYYLDGLVPLAYLLEDKKLLAEVEKWMEFMLNSQDEFGHFGPKDLTDWWPFGIACKVLTQYYEVTEDPRIIKLMEKFFKYMKNNLPTNHMHSWAVVRWADTVLSIIWLYNRNGDPELMELAHMVMQQGYNWTWHFQDFAHPYKQQGKFVLRTHVVNNAMAVKSPAVAWMLTGWQEHMEGSDRAIHQLDFYHGTAVDIFTGDEHYAGKDPSQGTEVCAVVEYMFSLENLLQIFAKPEYADRLETIAYNALPGTFTADMWAHQYDQQANQVLCTVDRRQWTNNRDDSNIFGLEPQYGCCTANFHQGWPKYVSHMWMATPDEGLAALTYGPCRVEATVRSGRKVTVEVETEYPFDETITIKIDPTEETDFPVRFRIPGWADGATLKVNGEAFECETGTFKVIQRTWKAGDTVEIVLPMTVRTERRYNDSITIKRGPLVYSLKIGERFEKIGGEEPLADYAVYPTTDWNYGLLIDPDNPEVEVVKKSVGDVVYGSEFAPIELKVKGRKVPQWQLEYNSAGQVPQSPVKSSEPVEELTLIPYGCAKLRITEFPLLEG